MLGHLLIVFDFLIGGRLLGIVSSIGEGMEVFDFFYACPIWKPCTCEL